MATGPVGVSTFRYSAGGCCVKTIGRSMTVEHTTEFNGSIAPSVWEPQEIHVTGIIQMLVP
jgi:hypothetical protein